MTYDSTKTFVWGSQGYSISGSGGTITLTLTGFWSVPNAAVAAANTLYRQPSAYPNNTFTDIFTDLNCPEDPMAGCYGNGQIFLGVNLSGVPRASFKYVVSHELGHAVQDALYGTQPNPYNSDTTVPVCKCEHVTSSNQEHCLQSRHDITSVQVEGWAHSFASNALNTGSQSNCSFIYYKEFLNIDGEVFNPPVGMNCFGQVRWMENNCPGSARGTEFDWMNFYWRLRNKDAYSYANFKSVYNQACGGSCDGVPTTPWATLSAAANTVFGVNGAKALAWNNQGDNFGVNH